MAITGLRCNCCVVGQWFASAGIDCGAGHCSVGCVLRSPERKVVQFSDDHPPAIPKSIRNAPFSADVSTQYDRLLSNGNHIHRETIGKVYRDVQGRVRTETQIPSPAGSSAYIVIQDPILHEVVHLDPRSKTANVHHLAEPLSVPAGLPNPIVGQKGTLVPTPPGHAGSAAVPLRPDPVKDPVIESLGAKTMQGSKSSVHGPRPSCPAAMASRSLRLPTPGIPLICRWWC